MEKLKKFIEMYGYRGFILALFHPLTFLFTNPVRLVQTLWNCRVLASGRRWGDYPHFLARTAVNSIFYWTRALNLDRYGRDGSSPYLGLGDYDLSRTFHYSLPSLYLYWRAGAVLLLLGIAGWWLSHFVWLHVPGVGTGWFVPVMGLTLISNLFYINAFGRQNYNIFGWFFIPMLLFGWYIGNYALAALALLGASFGSMTVVVLMGALSVVCSFAQGSLWPFLSVIPAGLKLATHLWPLLSDGKLGKTFSSVAKAIGITPGKAKYVRTEMVTFDVEQAYKLALYVQFIAVYALVNHQLPVLFTTAMLLWLVNANFIRFADEQSPLMLLFTVGVFTMLMSPVHSVFLLISFWLFIAPLFPFGKPLQGAHFLLLPVLKPFDVRPILHDLDRFLEPVPKNARVLMAFSDPEERYESVLDGYRRLVEPIHYVATQREIHFMPDWWGVFELNYEGAPDFWGREVEEVRENLDKWDADYVIVYQTGRDRLDPKWETAGFRVRSDYSWAKYDADFLPIKPYNRKPPHWWLLEPPDSTIQDD